MRTRGESAHIFNISIRWRFSLRRIYFVNRSLDATSVNVVVKRNVSAPPGNRTFMHPIPSDLDPKVSCKAMTYIVNTIEGYIIPKGFLTQE
jgi:hypothetical protein